MFEILQKAEAMFDILEYSYIVTLQSVLPAYYILRNYWSQLSTTDSAAGHILKRKLVAALDDKMWADITAIHVAASYLDPSLKSFSFIKGVKEQKGLLAQAEEGVREHTRSYSGIMVTDGSDEKIVQQESSLTGKMMYLARRQSMTHSPSLEML